MLNLSRRHLLAGTAAGLAASGTGARGQSGAPKRGGTLTATWGGFEPQALFVPPGGGSSPNFTSTKILERLVLLKGDLTFEPLLATDITPSADFKTYTIKLRPNATWHDGKPLTADDIVYNAMSYWKPISVGVGLKALTGVKAVDQHTAVMSFDAPVPEFFLKSVLARTALVIPKHLYDGRDIITNPINNTPIGTGPYKYKEWVRGSHAEFVRNETYWNPGLPYLDRLVIRWWRDPASRSAAFEAGQLDVGVFNPIPAPDIKRLTDSKRFVAAKTGYEAAGWVATLEFNARRPVVSKPEVRLALMHAIDRDFIADTIYFGLARPGRNLVPSSNRIFFDTSLKEYDFDVKKAGKMLDAAGYPLKGGSRFKVNLVSAGWFEENVKLGQYLRQALEDVGLEVELAIPDRATSLKRIYADYEYDIAISNSSGPPELVPTWTQYVTTDGIVKGAAFRNANGYSKPEVDGLVDKLATETHPEKRVGLAHDFQKILGRDLPITSLVELTPVTIARADVRNHSNNADYLGESWSDIWLDR